MNISATINALHGWRLWALMFGLTLLVFGNTLPHGYNLDDELVTNGHRFTSKGLSAVGDIFRSPYYEDEMGYSYEYRPITHLSFAIEHQILGEHSSVSHGINLIIYALTAGCVFLLIRGLFPLLGPVFPLLTALMFIVLPIHTETVASIKNREELLALLGGLLAAMALLRFLSSGKGVWLLVMLLALVVGVAAKLSVISFVVILPLIAVYRSASNKAFAAIVGVNVLVLAAAVMLRSHVLFPLLPLALLGMISMVLALRLIYMGSAKDSPLQGLLAHARALIENLQSVSMDWVQVRKVNVPALVFALVAIALAAVGIIKEMAWPCYLATALLLIHPVLLLRYHSSISILALVILVFTVLGDDGQIASSAIFYTGLMHLALYRHADSFGIKRLAMLQIALFVILAINAYLKDWDFIHYVPAMVMLAIVHLPLLFSDQKKHRKASWVAAAFISLFFLVEVVVEPDPSFASLIAIMLYVLVACISLGAKWRKVILMGMFLTPLIPTSFDAPHAPVQAEAPADRAPSQRLTKSPVRTQPQAGARPITYAEYPLGFAATVEERLATVSVVVAHYMQQTVTGYPQSFYYGYSYFTKVNLTDRKALLAFVLCIILVLAAIYFTYKQSPIGLGLWIWLTSIVVFSNVLEPVAGMAGDRLAYVASLGFCIVLAFSMVKLHEKLKTQVAKSVTIGMTVVLMITYSGITIARNAHWKDSLTLMRHDIAHVANSAQANNLLASHLMKHSYEPQYANEATAMRLEAIDHFKQSIRIYPDFFNVWYDLGRVYLIMNDPARALPCFKEAHALDTTFYDATFNVARLASQLGDANTAIIYFGKCIRSDPGQLQPYIELSYLYFRLDRPLESIAINEKAIAFNPNWKEPYDNIARTYMAMNEPDKALPYLKKLQEFR